MPTWIFGINAAAPLAVKLAPLPSRPLPGPPRRGRSPCSSTDQAPRALRSAPSPSPALLRPVPRLRRPVWRLHLRLREVLPQEPRRLRHRPDFRDRGSIPWTLALGLFCKNRPTVLSGTLCPQETCEVSPVESISTGGQISFEPSRKA